MSDVNQDADVLQLKALLEGNPSSQQINQLLKSVSGKWLVAQANYITAAQEVERLHAQLAELQATVDKALRSLAVAYAKEDEDAFVNVSINAPLPTMKLH